MNCLVDRSDICTPRADRPYCFDRSHLDLIPDFNAVFLELGLDESSVYRIDRRQDCFDFGWQPSHLYRGVSERPPFQGRCIQPHDDGGFWFSLFQETMDDGAVFHCVKRKDAG